MAAPVKSVADSSSSDDEQLKRCQEAVWESRPNKTKDGDSKVTESKRVVVADHDHDGNELQVTQGFRTHVAKKLGHFLDSCISESQTKTSHGLEAAKCDDEDDHVGFRLFSTSVPGQKAVEPPPPGRRRTLPSSSDSDSDMETRLREAAVSVKDLFPSLTLPSRLSPSSAEPPGSGKIKTKKKKVAEGEESHESALKKKKRKKQNQEESEQLDCAGSAPDPEQHSQVKVKRKKKKKQTGNAEKEA
ncbi:protein CUSTOS [Cololabis saira]|uniref:protein CUSTOS n=1 Tax=Cololabis saira TaxID=129043 RepID=UPI002AD339E2|nr:protein CUSTOS [Cololabis saira]